jgi:hypothetical protein
MLDALQHSVAAYGRDQGHPGTGHFDTYLALNRLALDALTPWTKKTAEADKAQAIGLARQCRSNAEAHFAKTGDMWSAVIQSEAQLVEALIDGRLGRAGEAGQAAFVELVASYAQTLANLTLKPGQLDSIVTQMELLSRFCDVLWLADGDVSRYRTASRLLELRQRVHPGARPRDDRPAPPPGEPTVRAAPAARRASARKAPKAVVKRGKRSTTS